MTFLGRSGRAIGLLAFLLTLSLTLALEGALPQSAFAGTIPDYALKTCDGNVKSKWVKKAAKLSVGEAGLPELAVMPSSRARLASPNKDRLIWQDVIRCVGGLPRVTRAQEDSLLKQLYCHIKWARPPVASARIWNLEAWRPNISWPEAKRFGFCNWGGRPPAATPTAPPPSPAPSGASFAHAVQYTCLDGQCGLTVRSGPGYSAFAALSTLNDGDTVQIVCQSMGEAVGPSPSTGAVSAVWDRLDSGGWISDLYVNTPNIGQFSPPIPVC